LKGLTKAADIFVSRIRGNLSSGNYPDEIEKGIETGSAKTRDVGASIDIAFKAPMSRAFEEGSGVHGPEGKKYKIEPKKPPYALAFEWNKMPRGPGPKFIGAVGGGDNPLLLFKYVDHPGIEARPYIRPAFEDKKEQMKQAIGREFKAVIRDGNKRVTRL